MYVEADRATSMLAPLAIVASPDAERWRWIGNVHRNDRHRGVRHDDERVVRAILTLLPTGRAGRHDCSSIRQARTLTENAESP